MEFRISDIKNFVATSSCRTIIEASKKLEISQPALSESIKRLELDAKSTLFYRSRSGIHLTSSGRVFLSKAKKLLQSYNDLTIEQDHSKIFADRVVSIGSHPVVAQYCLPKALAHLKKKAPDYKIELHHDLSRNIQMQVQRGHIDIGIVINPVQVPDLIIQKIGHDEVHVWGPKNDSNPDTVICNMDLFQTQSILKKWKNKPPRILSTDSLELICKLVNEGVGYGIIPEKAVTLSALKLKQMAELPHYRDEIALVYRPEFGKVTPERLIIESLKNPFL
ncbi:LysR family transcriptional regulator [Bdellovibrio sp. HCB274]|uniref:LysR family transcriptional regulator n=1 Tax=Bdellovibrio sp. HCB274 TaxID=3394361 RepID=UPI0039B3D711